MHRRTPFFLVLLVAGLQVACGGSDRRPAGPSPTYPPVDGTPTSPVVSVTVLRAGGYADLAVGGTVPYLANATLQNGQGRSCSDTATWGSSNPSIAFVAAGGNVTGVSAGGATLTATCWGGVSGSASVTVYEGAALAGTVRTTDGTPIAGAWVVLGDGSKGGKGTRSDDSGWYRMAGIVRGRSYSVGAKAAGYESAGTTLTLAAPETSLDFTLRVGVRLSGNVVQEGFGGIEGATVQILDGPNAGKSVATSLSGYYVFEHLLPGVYTVRAGKPGYEPLDKSVDASDDAFLEFKLRSAYGTCLVSVLPQIIDRFPSAGGDTTVVVSANAGRAWTASANQPWVQFPSGAGGTGPGLLLLHVLPSPAGATDTRSTMLRVGCSATEGENLKLTQLPDCRVSLSWAPDSPTSFPAEGGSGHVLLRTGVSGCHWQATSSVDWIFPVGVNSWGGDFDPFFTVRPNSSGLARSGVIVFGETPWEVKQAGR